MAISTQKILDALDSADGDSLSGDRLLPLEIAAALYGFEQSGLYRLFLKHEHAGSPKGGGIKLALAMGIEAGYKIGKTEKMEESLNV